jgi:hypothetical protein
MLGTRKKRILTAIAAAAATLAASAVTAHAASAATPSCGPGCVEPYSHLFGRNQVMDAIGGGFGTQHQRLILFRASQGDPAEDLTFSDQGTVHDFFLAGEVSAAFDLHYHALRMIELEYSPLGLDSGLCVSTWPGLHPAPGWILRLEPCGVGPWSLWAVSPGPGNSPGFFNVIAGTTTNFSHPLVWTYPPGSTPQDLPRPSVKVFPLASFSTGAHPNAQQWSARVGVIP